MGERFSPERDEGIGVHHNPSTEMGYSWKYGSEGSGLSFEVTYTNDGDISLTMQEGSMDLNALWFSNGDDIADGETSLSGKDNSLNMNGTQVAWDSYAKISDTGLKDGGLIRTGETFDLTDQFAGLDPATLTLGIRATSVNGDDSVKLVSTAEFFDDIPPELADASFAYEENQETDFLVGTVTATDADSSIASYQFTNGTDTSDDGLFVINDSGEISFATGTETSPANDYETRGNEFNYTIQATDSEGNVSGPAAVSITVEDVNDTSQQISESARVEWSSSGANDQLTISGLDNSGTPSNGKLIVTINGDFDSESEFTSLSIDTLTGAPTILNPSAIDANIDSITPGLTLASSSATVLNSVYDLEAKYTFDISDTALATILSDNMLMVDFQNSGAVNPYYAPDFLDITIEYTI